MNKKNLIIFFAIISIFLIFFNYTKEKYKMIYEVSNIGDLFDLFPKTPEQIRLYKDKCIKDLDEYIKKIIEIPNDKRTFENTIKAFDRIAYYYQPVHSTLQALELLSPKSEIRNTAHEEVLKLTNYFVDNVSTNVKLYKAFNYIDENAQKENLNETQKYFLNETMKDFKRNGLDLPTELLEKVRKLNKEIAEISLQFEANIAQDKTVASVSKDELKGLKEDFINSLKKIEDMYVLGCDYPTYNNIMENCEIESTRKKLYIAFFNRACPININLLNELINKRDEFAKLLGFKDYSHLALDGQMAKEPEKVYYFLNSLIAKAYLKKQNELNLWKSDLPESVILTEDGKIKPWDLKFIKTYYKKKHLSIDEQKVSEFFPMEHTIKQLLKIYEEFLSIKFKEVPITGFWHEDVKLIEAYDTHTEQLLGYLILDLYPRDNKFSHAAHTTIISCVRENDQLKPSVGIVMANFPKPTLTQPSLLKFKDVKTFFHEFGHAIHALLGCSEFYSFSGTNVKRDFVEMPSQMLENWLNDNEILKMVSRHYKTEEHLPDDLISKIVELEKFDSGDFVLHQTYYGLLSLDYYGSGVNKDSQAISKSLYNKILNYLLWIDDDHIQASFGHLTEYGPSYYGYLWSQVYAKDLFYEIKKHGLLNPAIGKKYIKEVIGQGGSKDPNELLKNFLGREPKEDAFFRDLGLN